MMDKESGKAGMPLHTPTRECIGCGGKFPKQALLRIVKSDGRISLDPDGKAPGRGAYLCRSRGCAEQMMKRRKLNRTFRQNVPEEIYQNLAEELERCCE